MDNDEIPTPPPPGKLVYQGEKASYYQLHNFSFNVDPNAKAGYVLLTSLMTLKGETREARDAAMAALQRMHGGTGDA